MCLIMWIYRKSSFNLTLTHRVDERFEKIAVTERYIARCLKNTSLSLQVRTDVMMMDDNAYFGNKLML